jgi:hypothetical protein
VLNLWTAPDCRSHFFSLDQLAAAAATAVRLSTERQVNVYVSAALLDPRVPARGGRGCAADAVAIPGLFGDVDVVKLGAQRPYFPTRAAARDFLARLTHPPNLLVSSGSGLQPWWLFDAPWWCADPAEHAAAASLLARWQRYLQRQAQPLGVDLDSTFDLARLLRVPGTINWKHGTRVTIESATDLRYTAADFAEVLADIPPHAPAAGPRGSRGTATHGITLDPDAEPPFGKLATLRRTSPLFDRLWRRELAPLDRSQSGFDFKLATLAAAAAWTNDEIVALLIAHRRAGGRPPHPRADYYQRTIAAARAAGGSQTGRWRP